MEHGGGRPQAGGRDEDGGVSADGIMATVPFAGGAASLTAPRRLTATLAALMAAQALLGRLLPHLYRDDGWVRSTWFGNDLVTLLLALPVLLAGLRLAGGGSRRGALLWVGGFGYAVYNYAFYLLGAELNAFFPLYAAAEVVAAAALILLLSSIDAARLAAGLPPGAPVRALGGYFTVLGLGLAAVWLGMWAAYVFAGRPTPVATDAFRLVAALDVTLMVPALACGGVLLWRRHAWGLVVASLAGVQGALYLVVLAVNTAVAIVEGLVAAPAELPVWGPLAMTTAVATTVLIGCVDRR